MVTKIPIRDMSINEFKRFARESHPYISKELISNDGRVLAYYNGSIQKVRVVRRR